MNYRHPVRGYLGTRVSRQGKLIHFNQLVANFSGCRCNIINFAGGWICVGVGPCYNLAIICPLRGRYQEIYDVTNA